MRPAKRPRTLRERRRRCAHRLDRNGRLCPNSYNIRRRSYRRRRTGAVDFRPDRRADDRQAAAIRAALDRYLKHKASPGPRARAIAAAAHGKVPRRPELRAACRYRYQPRKRRHGRRISRSARGGERRFLRRQNVRLGYVKRTRWAVPISVEQCRQELAKVHRRPDRVVIVVDIRQAARHLRGLRVDDHRAREAQCFLQGERVLGRTPKRRVETVHVSRSTVMPRSPLRSCWPPTGSRSVTKKTCAIFDGTPHADGATACATVIFVSRVKTSIATSATTKNTGVRSMRRRPFTFDVRSIALSATPSATRNPASRCAESNRPRRRARRDR
jgi:hypothetical protein